MKCGLTVAIASLGFSLMCDAALVAEWTFDDPGDLGSDSAGAFDLSAGAGFASPTYDENGKSGGAASFVDDSAFTTPTNIYPNGDFTFSAWFKPSDTAFSTVITPFSRRGGFELYASGGAWRARLWKSDQSYDLKVGPAIVADEWVHIAIYYNAISGPDASGNYTGTFRFWVNGENYGGVNNAEYNANDTYDMHLGSKSTGDYRGLMDEVRIFDTALSGPEIRALADRPVAEWTFDDPGDLGNDTGAGYVGTGAEFDLSAAAGFTAPDYDASGKVGGAALFANDTAFVTPANVYPNGNFTFAGWFKPADTGISAAITPLSRRGGFELYAYNGEWRARVWKQDNTFDYRVATGVVADEWTHIALQFTTTNAPDASGNYTGTFRFWVNGENLGGITNAEYCANDTYTLNVGAAGGYDYRGLMDEVRIYDYPLSEEKIRELAFWAPMIGDIILGFDGWNAIIGWEGSVGMSYSLQFRESLADESLWSNAVIGISGIDGSMSATTTATSSEAFYRIVADPYADLYVAASSLGNGSGMDPGNAAVYTNAAFWNAVQQDLDSGPVTVTLLDGNYQDSLALDSLGHVGNTLTFRGESVDGVVFNGVGSAAQIQLAGCRNMVVENLNFTGNRSGYALQITEAGALVSSNIMMNNCNWHDMPYITYGAAGVHHGSHDVTFTGCSFERIGNAAGSHMIYNAYNADYVGVVNSYFEDCAGSYVRFRAGSDYGMVSNCTFVSTQTYPYRSATEEVFVEFPVFNDVDPGDETFARFGTVVDNTFAFHSGAPAKRIGIRYLHKGYDPPGWNYLMTASEGAVLEGSDALAKKNLLNVNCGIDFDQVLIAGNLWQNETGRIYFASYAGYGAVSKGWDDESDISDIVFGP